MGVYPGIGGVERVSTVLANNFIEKGYQVHICSFEGRETEISKTLSRKVELINLEYPVNSKKNCLLLRSYIIQNKINILINQWCMPYYVSNLIYHAIKGTECKLIAVHHNLPNTNNHIKYFEEKITKNVGNKFINKLKLVSIKTISRLSLRYTYHKSNRYVVLSKSFIPIAKKFIWKKHTKKILSISNPITLCDTYNEDFEKINEIIYVGRIEYKQKRNDRLVGIWEHLYKQYPNWKLTIVGDGPDKTDLEKQFSNKNIRNVDFVGFQDPTPFYRRSKILLLTSDYEGFPLVITEAMNYGVVPIVYGSFSTVNDVIDDNISGIIIQPPYSEEGMIYSIKTIIDNKSKLEQMKYDCIQKSKLFSIDSIMKQWIDLFEELTNSNQPH